MPKKVVTKKKGWGIKSTAKSLVKAGTKYVKGRYAPGGKLDIGTIARDLAYLKLMINVEKKFFKSTSASPLYVGQVNGNVSGHNMIYATPRPTQGDGQQYRQGSSLKLISQRYNLQFVQLSAQQSAMKGVIYVVETRGKPIGPLSIANEIDEMFIGNQWISNYNAGTQVYDLTCRRNVDYMGNCRILRKVPFSLKQDNISGQTQIKTVSFGMKYKNRHVKFDGNTTDVSAGEIFLVIMLDSGNANSVTACTLNGVPITAVSTGTSVNWDITSYFVDN